MKKLRWYFARLVDKISPHRYCWASLCIWVEFGDSRLRDVEGPRECRRDARTNEPGACCYCGRYISPQFAIDMIGRKRYLEER